MRDAVALLSALDDANVKAFIAAIRAGEGTADDDGYRRMFGGELFDSFVDHPRRAITKKLGGTPITSTAAGAGQFLARTWDECAAALGLRDFSPKNQLLAIVFLIERRKALEDVIAGRFADAVRKCNREWASLPGSPYGQPTRTLAQAQATYLEHGGALVVNGTTSHEPQADLPSTNEPQTEPTMPLPLIIGALLPSIIEAIPKLGKLFGSGSEVAERNVKAAELAVSIVQEAVGARNAQEAAEMVKADPAMAQVATQAVEARWYQLDESGGGGIEGAGKRDAALAASGSMLQSPSFWVALALLPLVYMIVANVVGILGAPLSDEVRSAIANGVVGIVLGGLIGYYYGQSTSRNRTPQP